MCSWYLSWLASGGLHPQLPNVLRAWCVPYSICIHCVCVCVLKILLQIFMTYFYHATFSTETLLFEHQEYHPASPQNFLGLNNRSFSALTLLVVHQEEHPACKNWVKRCWHDYVWSEVQMICLWSSWCDCHPTFTSLKSRIVYLSGADLLRLSWKRGH